MSMDWDTAIFQFDWINLRWAHYLSVYYEKYWCANLFVVRAMGVLEMDDPKKGGGVELDDQKMGGGKVPRTAWGGGKFGTAFAPPPPHFFCHPSPPPFFGLLSPPLPFFPKKCWPPIFWKKFDPPYVYTHTSIPEPNCLEKEAKIGCFGTQCDI